MSKLNKQEDTILKFLEWAIENQRMELHVEHSKPFATEVDLPAGWGSSSSELIGIKIYYRAKKISRSQTVKLLKEWSSR